MREQVARRLVRARWTIRPTLVRDAAEQHAAGGKLVWEGPGPLPVGKCRRRIDVRLFSRDRLGRRLDGRAIFNAFHRQRRISKRLKRCFNERNGLWPYNRVA